VGTPVVYTNSTGDAAAFVIGRDNALYHRVLSRPTTSTQWVPFGSLGGGFTGIPAVGFTPDRRLELFVIGRDGVLYHKWQVAPNGGWSNWYSHGSRGGGFATGPSLRTTSDGALEIYVVGRDQAIYQKNQVAPGGIWTEWLVVSSVGGGSKVAVHTDDTGRFGLFVTSQDNALYDVAQIFSSGWFPNPFGAAFAGTPAVGWSPDGRLELFVLGIDGALYHKWQVVTGGGWSDWYSHGKPPSPFEPPPCIPKTQCRAGAQCGSEDDGCRGRISCGSCRAGQTCNLTANLCMGAGDPECIQACNERYQVCLEGAVPPAPPAARKACQDARQACITGCRL
jgi:hypothetical protein